VIAFGSADSHDEHYFAQPAGMIRADVVDPKLTLENKEITRRYLLLQNYRQDKLPDVDPLRLCFQCSELLPISETERLS
jgi:hypothetical protein